MGGVAQGSRKGEGLWVYLCGSYFQWPLAVPSLSAPVLVERLSTAGRRPAEALQTCISSGVLRGEGRGRVGRAILAAGSGRLMKALVRGYKAQATRGIKLLSVQAHRKGVAVARAPLEMTTARAR